MEIREISRNRKEERLRRQNKKGELKGVKA